MKTKKAQFYIIAAVIIAVIVLTMASVPNYVIVKEEPVNFYDLGKNLQLEGAWVIDYGIYNNENLNTKITDFTGSYTDYLSKTGEEFDLVIIYGNQEQAYKKKYSIDNTGGVTAGGISVPLYDVIEYDPESVSGTTQISLLNNTYDISLKNNENFLFIITTSTGFENYVFESIE